MCARSKTWCRPCKGCWRPPDLLGMSFRFARPVLNGVLWLSYPLILFCGLRWGSPRAVALLLLVTLLLRRRADARRLWAGLEAVDHAVLAGLVVHAVAAAWTNSEGWVRFFPCSMNVGMLLLFARSLTTPQSMVERFARLHEPALSADGVAYTRRVTQVWCVFLLLNCAVAFWTAIYASRDGWALYNGLLAYVLMGTLFAAEWLYRRYRLRRQAAGALS